MPSCGDCRFFFSYPISRRDVSGPIYDGSCHRFPPDIVKYVSGENSLSRYPETMRESWCGEHESKDDPPRRVNPTPDVHRRRIRE